MKKILIADDTKTWIYFHSELLAAYYGDDVSLTVCESARTALKLIHENMNPKFDIIITDMQMESAYYPLTAGEWLVKNIKMIKEYKNTPIIIISAMFDLEKRAKRLGVECIPKSKLINNKLLLKYVLEKLEV